MAVSGGADSVALLAVLADLAKTWELRLTVAHLNHCLRGSASAGDAAFVAKIARQLRVPCVIARSAVRNRAQRAGISLEMAGRRARYDFFRRLARKRGCDMLATAHTADDQAETVLLNMTRGAGAAGLSGIPYVSLHGALRVVRPLRDARRSEVLRFLEKRGLAWREDVSNADPVFLRNRARLELLPMLEKRFNPAVRNALLRLGDIMAGENEWMDFLADDVYRNCRGADAALDAGKLAEFHVAARRRVLRRWLADIGLKPEEIDFETVERLDALHMQRALERGAVNTAGGLTVRCNKNGFLQAVASPALGVQPFCVPLAAPGRTMLRGRHVRITVSIAPGIVVERPGLVGGLPARASLSLKVWRRAALRARSWQPGDRMQPFGMAGTKKLQDIFGDAGIPRAARHSIPLIECRGEIVWVPGFRIARNWAVGAGERNALQMLVEEV